MSLSKHRLNMCPQTLDTDMAQNWHKLGFIVQVTPTGAKNGSGDLDLPNLCRNTASGSTPSGGGSPKGSRGFAAHPAALASFDAHARSPGLALRMPRPDVTRRRLAKALGPSPSESQNSPIQTLESLKTHLPVRDGR